jgi:hypothetical protein
MVPKRVVNPLLHMDSLWPTLEEIRIEQESCIAVTKQGFPVFDDKRSKWLNSGKNWMPD